MLIDGDDLRRAQISYNNNNNQKKYMLIVIYIYTHTIIISHITSR